VLRKLAREIERNTHSLSYFSVHFSKPIAATTPCHLPLPVILRSAQNDRGVVHQLTSLLCILFSNEQQNNCQLILS
jgi:hypothetical protein